MQKKNSELNQTTAHKNYFYSLCKTPNVKILLYTINDDDDGDIIIVVVVVAKSFISAMKIFK